MIKCKNCGADMRYDIGKQRLICDYCDSTLEVINVHGTDITSEEQVMDGIVHTCPQCGAEIFTTDDTAATFCSYCGSSVLLESRLVTVNKPDFIIPFKISKEQAEEAYKKKLSKAVFAPAALKKAEIESIRGIYMPYWEYHIKDSSTVRVRFEQNEHREGSYLISDQYEILFRDNIESDGLEFDASSKFPDDLSQACAPFYFKESKLFNSGYLSGFYADLGDVDPYTYTPEACEIVSEVAAEEILDNSDIDDYGISKSTMAKKINNFQADVGLAMYPVWFSSARDKKGKYINYAVINGQTGKVAADLPVDKKKILIGTLIFAIPLFLLMYFLFTPNPISTVVIMAILSIIGTYIGMKKIDEMGRDDKGAGKFKKKPTEQEKKERKAEKTKMRWRMIATLIICFLIIVIHPVMDIYYYIVAVAAGVLCGWTYFRLFELHNRSTLRPLPQLEKRGGEDR